MAEPEEKREDWKREVSEVLRKHNKISPVTIGRLALVISQGGVRDAEWLNKKVE